jgi:L-idonate 5-dehydrogenase
MLLARLYGAKDLRIETDTAPPVLPGQVKVRFGAGGICGSDLSYYFKGAVGDFKVMEPFCLGHEVAGEVVELGEGALLANPALNVGDRVAVNPNHPCRVCRSCLMGNGQLCLKMKFFGSAAIFPHVQGVYKEFLVVDAQQCFVVPKAMDFRVAAMAEPLAVALHAIKRAGSLVGKRVLVTGAGPIGSLVILAAKRAGAAQIVVTDVSDGALARLDKIGGVTATVNGAKDAAQVESWYANKGTFDLAFECSGAPSAVATCLRATISGGRVVLVGIPGVPEVALPLGQIVAREVDLVGAFRFDAEYGWAVKELSAGTIDVSPLLTHSFNLRAANDAFAIAIDREQSMKVHLTL